MGVKEFHKFIASIVNKGTLSDHEGRTVAIDASGWLYKGSFINPVAIAEQQHNNKFTDGVDAEKIPVEYVIRKALSLKKGCGVNPYLVIDGPALPAKEDENKERLRKRKEAFRKAKAAHASGDDKQARSLYMQACGTSQRMQYLLVEACAANGIQFIIAPHEADAQLVSLVNTGQAHLAISEDGDLTALGCQRVLYKLDLDNFTGDLVLHDDIINDDNSPFKGFTVSMLALHCIVFGNDYSDGVHGYGHTKARNLVRVNKTPEAVFAELERLNLPADSIQKMKCAYDTMQHYPIFVPTAVGSEYKFTLSYLAQPHNNSSMRIDMDERTASGVACGILDGSGELYYDKLDVDDDDDEFVDQTTSSTDRTRRTSGEVHQDNQAEARHMIEQRQWLYGKVSELKGNVAVLERWQRILAEREDEYREMMTQLPEDNPHRMAYEKYRWVAGARLEDLKKQLPNGVSFEELEEDTQLQCIVILREFVLNDDGTIKDNPAMLNACKYMLEEDDRPRNYEMTASLCRKGHHAFAIKKTDRDNGRHFKRNEVHLEGTGDPSDDTVLQVRQIQIHSSSGDVAAFITEQIAGETFRSVLGGSGLAMNRCVSGVVRDTEGFFTHASGVLVIHDPLTLLQSGAIGINKRQSESVLIETKHNFSSITEDYLLKCTTEQTRGYCNQVSTPVPYVISTELIPTDDSVVTITRTNYAMRSLVKGNDRVLTIGAIGDGRQVISACTKFGHNIFVVPFKKSLGLQHDVGDIPNKTIYEALVARDTSRNIPVLLSTSKHENEGTIVSANGTIEARSIIKSRFYEITEASLLKSGPIKVLDNINGVEIYAHLYDPEVHIGSPGEVFDKSLCEALKSRDVCPTHMQSQGAVMMYATEDDADRHHRPLVGAHKWASVRTVIGGRRSNQPDTATAIAGTIVNSPCFGEVYVRGHVDGDPKIEDKKVTAFFPQAGETAGLFDRISDAIWNGKDKPAEPELASSRRANKRRRSA